MANTEMLSHGKWSNQSSESISEGRMVLSSLGGLGWGWKWWVWSQAGDREINHSLKINTVNGRICWANRSSELLKGSFFFLLYIVLPVPRAVPGTYSTQHMFVEFDWNLLYFFTTNASLCNCIFWVDCCSF